MKIVNTYDGYTVKYDEYTVEIELFHEDGRISIAVGDMQFTAKGLSCCRALSFLRGMELLIRVPLVTEEVRNELNNWHEKDWGKRPH